MNADISHVPQRKLAIQGDFVATAPGQSMKERRSVLTHQLRCLTTCMLGEGLEDFRKNSNEVQEGVMWLVADLAQQIDTLCEFD